MGQESAARLYSRNEWVGVRAGRQGSRSDTREDIRIRRIAEGLTLQRGCEECGRLRGQGEDRPDHPDESHLDIVKVDALACRRDRRRENVGEGESPTPRMQGQQPLERTRHGNTAPAHLEVLHGVVAKGHAERLHVRDATIATESGHIHKKIDDAGLAVRLGHQTEATAPETREGRLRHGRGEGAGDDGIDRGAAVAQHGHRRIPSRARARRDRGTARSPGGLIGNLT